jgi:hypothetical protein
MPGHPFPDSPVLTNFARSYLRRADFLMADAYHSSAHGRHFCRVAQYGRLLAARRVFIQHYIYLRTFCL